jgi:hypothetical protein
MAKAIKHNATVAEVRRSRIICPPRSWPGLREDADLRSGRSASYVLRTTNADVFPNKNELPSYNELAKSARTPDLLRGAIAIGLNST